MASTVTNFGSAAGQSDESRRVAEVLLRCAVAAEPRSVECEATVCTVLERASAVGLAPRVASRLKRTRSDEDGAATADAALAEFTAHGTLQLVELGAVSDILKRAGIASIVLKGAAMLLRGVRAELGERHMDDVDLLVPAASLTRSTELLLAHGYRLAERMSRPGIDGRPVAEQEVRAGDHAAPGMISPRGVAIDLHHHVPDSALGTFDALRAHCDTVSFAGSALLVPRPGPLFAMVCEHVVRHHACRFRYLLRHVADMAQFERTYGAAIWQEAAPFAAPGALRASRALRDFVEGRPELAARLLIPRPAAWTALDLVWEASEMAARFGRDVRTDPRRIARKLVPAREFVAASYGTSPNDRRLPLLYVHRLLTFRWLTRPLRG